MRKYECGLTGEREEGMLIDKQESPPLGWFEVTVKRRIANPHRQFIQHAKARELGQIMQQLPEEHWETEKPYVAFRIDAAYAAYEAKYPETIDDYTEVVYVADTPDAIEALTEILELLGADPLEPVEEDEEQGSEGEEEEG